MSKIGKKPIAIPSGITVEQKDGALHVKGKQGELTIPVLPYCLIETQESEGSKFVAVRISHTNRQARANWGTMASLTKNALVGVHDGFKKQLQLEGIGYRANLEGATLVLSLGFSHPIKYTPPAGILLKVEKNIITITGIDKAVVGETAAVIRKFKKPEPYQGKGIRYVGEVVRRKAGKKAAAAAGATAS